MTALGIGSIPSDGNEKELIKILQSPRASKMQFLETTTGVPLDVDSPDDRLNRLVQHAFSMKMTHKAEGRRPFTLKKRFQEEFRQVALSAEQVSQGVLEKFFGRLIRENPFSVQKISQCQDSSMRSQLSGGSLETLRSMENLPKHHKGILLGCCSKSVEFHCLLYRIQNVYFPFDVNFHNYSCKGVTFSVFPFQLRWICC